MVLIEKLLDTSTIDMSRVSQIAQVEYEVNVLQDINSSIFIFTIELGELESINIQHINKSLPVQDTEEIEDNNIKFIHDNKN